MKIFSKDNYDKMLEEIFQRFPSVQTSSFADAYKPGLERMIAFDLHLGNPNRRYRTIHIAGTNGKGSVSSMLASILAGAGLKVGLYTSPHILDFRERMRVVTDTGVSLVSKEYVYEFLLDQRLSFEELDLSFFEITTGMAFKWFADEKVDVAVVETGLGGRLDSTNIIHPELSIITSIGLDHCDLLGDTLQKIAAEKAGIFKSGVKALVDSKKDETEEVFRTCASDVGAELYFADSSEPSLWQIVPSVLQEMDLRGRYQTLNIRTVLSAVDILKEIHPEWILSEKVVKSALVNAASRTAFHGRWERISTEPDVICDIGHNAAALSLNFKQLKDYLDTGEYTSLIIVYGAMSDKFSEDLARLFPEDATWIFTAPQTRRALPAESIMKVVSAVFGQSGYSTSRLYVVPSVRDAVTSALRMASEYGGKPLVYIGGSTFVVSEALPLFG